MLNKIGWWLMDNIPMGGLAPRLFGWLIGSKPVQVELMKCPDDLCKWVNENSSAQWFLYDLNLMPEQITTAKEVCALRGFQKGWQAHEIAKAPK